MKNKFIALLVCLLFFGCSDKKVFIYRYDDLERAWQDNDSIYVKNWVLNSVNLDDVQFFDRINEFAHVTNFCYGYLDLDDIKNKSFDYDMDKMRSNVYIVNNIYVESCIFMNKKISYDTTLIVQKKYWYPRRNLTNKELLEIKLIMQELCNL